MTVNELIDELLHLVDTNRARGDSPVQALVSEEYLQRPVERIEVQGVGSAAIVILRTPEAS